jgi:hypothetical protein
MDSSDEEGMSDFRLLRLYERYYLVGIVTGVTVPYRAPSLGLHSHTDGEGGNLTFLPRRYCP